jgi:putative ATP-binding cassette transporter
MVWVALLYAGLGNWLAHTIGRPLIGLNFNQQRFEADFRYTLVRFRENMEGVALYRGEAEELRNFGAGFQSIFSNWWAIMRRTKQLTWFTSGYGQLAVIFPFVVAAPRFFSGAIPLGGLMQTASAFGFVRESLSWFITAYPAFAIWKATVDRLIGFHRAIEAAQREQQQQPGIEVAAGNTRALRIEDLELRLPSGERLLAHARVAIEPGSRVLIQGASGTGKSTLLRAIAGIWPFGRGYIYEPSSFHALFLPQRPYFPLGTLRDAVCYPSRPDDFGKEQVEEVLTAVGLGHLLGRLDASVNWSMQLSGGEQQRVAFARALLQKPAWLFLDEATSNLDEASQGELYQLIIKRLPGTTIVSVAHRDELTRYHTQRIELRPRGEGPHELRMLGIQPA